MMDDHLHDERNPCAEDDRRKQWLTRALRYLARYPVTRWEFVRWLRRKHCPDDVIRFVVRECRKYHYLDDRMALKSRFRKAFRKGWSRNRLKKDLRSRGIPLRVIERCFQKWYPEEREYRLLRRRVTRERRLKPRLMDRETFVRYFCQAGFPLHLVLKTWEVMSHEESGNS